MKKIDIVVRNNTTDLGDIVFPRRVIERDLIIKTLRPNCLLTINNAMILSESNAYMYPKKSLPTIRSELLLEEKIETRLSVTKSIDIVHNTILQEMIRPTRWREIVLEETGMELHSAVTKINSVKYRKLSEIDELMLEELDDMRLEDIDYVEV